MTAPAQCVNEEEDSNMAAGDDSNLGACSDPVAASESENSQTFDRCEILKLNSIF